MDAAALPARARLSASLMLERIWITLIAAGSFVMACGYLEGHFLK
jgi:hypothetical protein